MTRIVCYLFSSASEVFGLRKPGVARRQLTFLLRRQKKSKQKKRRPCCLRPPSLALRGQPAVLGPAGVGLELATLRQSPALIRLALRSSAHTEGVGSGDQYKSQTRQGHAMACPCLPGLVLVFVPSPSGRAEERRQKRIRDRDCLSRRRVRARPRFWRAPQVELLGSDANFAAVLCTAPKGRAIGSANLVSDPNNSPDHRVAFLLGTFLWRRKEKCLACRGETRLV